MIVIPRTQACSVEEVVGFLQKLVPVPWTRRRRVSRFGAVPDERRNPSNRDAAAMAASPQAVIPRRQSLLSAWMQAEQKNDCDRRRRPPYSN